jgi:hypothetical protein
MTRGAHRSDAGIEGASKDDLERVCVVCGGSFAGRRADARVCGGACRAALSRSGCPEDSRWFWTRYVSVRAARGAQRRTQGNRANAEQPAL